MEDARGLTTPEGLADEVVDGYRQLGFVHLPRVLTEAEVTEFLADAREQLDRQRRVSWDDEGGNVMDWVADIEVKSEAMRRLALHPRITGIARRLAGRPLRMFKSELLVKPGEGSAATPPHFDDFAFPFAGEPITLTAWVALVDVPVERGCMGFIPGSHLRLDLSFEGVEGTTGGDQDWSAEAWNPLALWPDLAWEPRVTVPLRAGDCTFHHSKVVHWAGANTTDEARVSLATVYMDAESRYDPERCFGGGMEDEPGDYQPTSLRGLQAGQPLRGERFPRVGDA